MIQGIFPPVATPFSGCTKHVAFNHLKSNLSKLTKTKLKGFLVQGSNGEFASMNLKDRVEMVKVTKEIVGDDKIVLAGSGAESTLETIDLTNKMAEVGADAAVVITPSFFKNLMQDDNLVHHYRRVADASKIPIILYNVPKFTHVRISPEVIVRLANHENIIGMKESDGASIYSKMPIVLKHLRLMKTNPDFTIVAGSAGFLTDHLSLGATGGICALANILPSEVVQLYNNRDEELQAILADANELVTTKYGVAGLKYAMDIVGFYGGPCREPLLPLDHNAKRDIENCFSKFL